MEEGDGQKPKRARRLDVMLDRQASGSVKAFSDKLGSWQEQAARLQAIIRFSKSDDDKISALRELCLLQGELESVRMQLEGAAGMLSDTVVRHSRFQDAVRSVERLEGMLNGIVAEAAPHREQ